MNSPERFTILVGNKEIPENTLYKVRGILRDMGLDESHFRVYMEGKVKTVINVVIDSLYSEEFILKALNQQIKFVPTNEKIRRIMSLVSADFDIEDNNDLLIGKRELKKSENSILNEEFEEEENSFVLDSSSVKFAEMLQSDEPEEIIEEAEELIENGEDIQRRAKDILRTTVENEIKKAVKGTVNNPRNLQKSMKVLTDLMTNDILNNGEFKDLSQSAGFNAIKILEKNDKYSDELLKILENEKIDDYVRMKSLLIYIKNLKKKNYPVKDIREKINLDLAKEIYSKTQQLLQPEEKQIINPLL